MDTAQAREFAATTSRATAPKVLRKLFSFAKAHYWMGRNPAANTGEGTRRAARSGVPWPAEAVSAFFEVADRIGHASVGTAIMLSAETGWLLDDVLRMTWRDYCDGKLTIGKAMAAVTPSPQLADRLGNARAKWPIGSIIVRDTTGSPLRGRDKFGDLFRMVRAEVARQHPTFVGEFLAPGHEFEQPEAFTVATKDLLFKDLRHTAVMRLASAGHPRPSIAAHTGLSRGAVSEIAEHYLARMKARAGGPLWRYL